MRISVLFTFFLSILSFVPFYQSRAQNDVTFQLSMSVKMLQGSFKPDSGDVVFIRGNVNGVNVAYDLADPDHDSIYTLTASIPTGELHYRYAKTLRMTEGWELIGDPAEPPYGERTYSIAPGAQTVPTVYFNERSTFAPLVFHNITFQVDLSVFISKGLFNPATDSIVVRGDFNWFGFEPAMTAAGGGIYQKTLRLVEGDGYQYKFWQSTPGATDNGWEVWCGPDPNYGDRSLVVGTSDVVLPVKFFDDIETGQHPTAELEPNSSAGVANAIEYGDSIVAGINPAADVDYYRFLAVQGEGVEIHISIANGTDPLDPLVRLFDWSGASYQNWGGGDIRFTQAVPASGVYFLRVSAIDTWGDFPNGVIRGASINPGSIQITESNTKQWAAGFPASVASRRNYGALGLQFAQEAALREQEPRLSGAGGIHKSELQGNVGSYTLTVKRIEPRAPSAEWASYGLLLSNVATLRGWVYPNGLPTTVTFQYGTSTAYENSVDAIQSPMNNWDGGIASSPPITGLPPNTLYHIRMVATNGLGSSTTDDAWFVTPSEPDGWEVVHNTVEENYSLTGIDFKNRSHGMALGDYAPILTTEDGGATWIQGSIGNNSAVAFYDNNLGLYCGWAKIARTTNGGESWETVYAANNWIFGICFLNSTTAIAVGQSGIVLRSTDAGASWQLVSTPISSSLRSVAASGPDDATAVGDNGTVAYTIDRGQTWTSQTIGTSAWLSSVSFGSASVGYIGGESAFRTTDGGLTWHSLPNTMYTIDAINGTEAVGVGAQGSGLSFLTSDGGATWVERPTGCGSALRAVHFLDLYNGFAVGDYSTILRYSGLPGNSWITRLEVKDTCGATAALEYGLVHGATDGIDAALGEAELPPLPPEPNIFETRFVLPGPGSRGSLKDYRSDTLGQASWRLRFQGCGNTITLMWDSAALPAGTFFLKDEFTGEIVKVNMKNQSSLLITNTGVISSLLLTYTSEVSGEVIVTPGWNIVSVPLLAATPSAESLFPGALSPAYEFDTVYRVPSQLVPGKGYWLKFPSGHTFSVLGLPVAVQDISVKAGWNMIGPYEQEMVVSAITQEPSGIVSSNYWEYNGGYEIPSALKVGKGCWVKCSQAGVLHLSAGLGKTRVLAQEKEPDPMPRLILEDASGTKVVLFLCEAKEMRAPAFYEMPPLPPAGTFDARFADNTSTEAIGKGMHEIRLTSLEPPLKVSVEHITGVVALKLEDGLGGAIVNEPLIEGKVIVINGKVGSLLLEETAVSLRESPTEFELSQNYPNPFNPTTTIKFALPVASHVTLEVYNMLGQKVAELVQSECEAGYHAVEFNAIHLASGMYFCHMQAGRYTSIKKMLLLR